MSALPTSVAEVPEPVAAPPVDAPARSERSRRLLILGDSLSDPKAGGGGYLRALTQACPAYQLDNRSRGGFMVNQMLRRFEAKVSPAELAKFTDLVVFGGVNDLYSDETAGRSFERITRDLSAIYRRAKAAKLRVTALTVAPWGGFRRYFTERRGAATLRLNAWIAQQRAEGLVDAVVDAHAVLSCGDAAKLCPDYEPPFKDGLHFGPRGHERLGRELVSAAFPECVSKP